MLATGVLQYRLSRQSGIYSLRKELAKRENYKGSQVAQKGFKWVSHPAAELHDIFHLN